MNKFLGREQLGRGGQGASGHGWGAHECLVGQGWQQEQGTAGKKRKT